MPNQPNILIVMSDEHAPQVSSPYGHPFIHTPSLQRLADEGVVFQNSYCNSPLCVPSRASFMTGQHLYRIGVWDNGVALSTNEPTWAHRLNAAGYDTAIAGKMHFVGPDQHHGFRQRLVEEVHGRGNIGGPDWTSDVKLGGPAMRRRILEAEPGDSPHQQFDDEVTARSVEFLRDARRKERPWALCAGYITPHFPLIVRQPYFDRYFPEHADVPEWPAGHLEQQHPQSKRLRDHFNTHNWRTEQVGRARAAYYGLITYFDEQLGALLDALAASGQRENTVVIYVSDHGEMYGEHGMWWKCSFYEQSVRIPTIIACPARFQGGRMLGGVTSLLDVVRTVVEQAGANPDELDGDDLTPLLEGRAAGWKDLALAEYEAHGTVTPGRMLRKGRYKLNYYHGEPVELFDLEADPGEVHDLAGKPEYAGVQRDLTALVLRDWDPERIRQEVLTSQRKRRIVAAGQQHERHGPWRPPAR